MKEFNVINYDINGRNFKSYNIIPYLISCYNKEKNKPKTFDEFKEFIENESMYQWWSRCQYEIILSPWPCVSAPNEGWDTTNENDVQAWKEHWKKHLNGCKKIDVYDQVMMNLDVITKLVMETVLN